MHQIQSNLKSDLSLGNRIYSGSTLPALNSPTNMHSPTSYSNNGFNFNSRRVNVHREDRIIG